MIGANWGIALYIVSEFWALRLALNDTTFLAKLGGFFASSLPSNKQHMEEQR